MDINLVKNEQKFPLVTVDALNREISDYAPLLQCTGERNQVESTYMFKFEFCWLLHEVLFLT
jgi:hypothetical protein